jgi:proline dehydrogenase
MSDIREGHDKSGTDEEINQLVEQLKAAERDLPFVGLDWFRNDVLPRCGHHWAKDPKKIDSLLWQAFERFLVLTWHVPDPDERLRSITTIIVNRRPDKVSSGAMGRSAKFTPIRVKGRPVSEIIMEDRR